jgi:deazaflavin-dependent oxidoreductase (nitroreductase family)
MGCMQIPQWVARFNKYVTNPVQRIWAGYAPTFGILEHVGRKSGKQFKTPLTVFSTDEGVAILLTYGPNRDWLKNITAANGGRMRRYGRTFVVTDPRMTSKAEAAGSVTGLWRPIFARLPFDQAVLLRRS